MAEDRNMETLAALMGQQGQEALQMLHRMERLKRLMGTAKSVEQTASLPKEEKGDILSRSRDENIITAAIPFLDREYQKEIYVIVRLMEMRRVLQGGMLEVREKAQELPEIRRRKLLGAILPHLSAKEQENLQSFIRIMEMRAIMEQGDMK